MTDVKDRMQDIGQAVNERIPEGYGFVVMVFPFDGTASDERLNYCSNANRGDVINALKEWLIKCGAEEDWMKHL